MLSRNDEVAISLYGCFAARKMLEAGCTALLSAVDPLRLLVLREFQLKGRYELGERHPASIDWRADIISSKQPTWSEATAPDKFIRALLGGHVGEVAWSHAISQLSMIDPEIPTRSSWIEEITSQYEARCAAAQRDENGELSDPSAPSLAILSSFRQGAQQLFSTLSKGVHLEFIVDQTALFDIPTVTETMKRAAKTITQLAFISHMIDCRSSNLDLAHATDLLVQIDRDVNGHA
jgi:hypothetical protein